VRFAPRYSIVFLRQEHWRNSTLPVRHRKGPLNSFLFHVEGDRGTELRRKGDGRCTGGVKRKGREMGEMGKNYAPYAIFRNDFEIEKAAEGG